MKKFSQFWLIKINAVFRLFNAEEGYSVQKSKKTRRSNWSIYKKLTDSQSNASLGCRNIWIRWKFASKTMAGVLSRFSFATTTTIQQLKNSCNNENTVKITAFWLSVWKSGVYRRELPRKSKIMSRPRLTLCLSDSTSKLKTNMVNPRKRRFHSIPSKIDSDTDFKIPWTV